MLYFKTFHDFALREKDEIISNTHATRVQAKNKLNQNINFLPLTFLNKAI